MTPVPRVTPMVSRALAMMLLAASAAWAQAPASNAQGAALAEFQARLQQYLELRTSLAGKLRPMAVTNEAGEITARQEALGAAMRTARKAAKPGDLIPAPVAELIAKTVAEDFKRRRAAVDRAVLKEVPNATPVINKVYPAPEELTTMPPLVLNKLPRLPDNLQYRYFGRSVVLFDGDLHIVVDYVPGVLPPH